MAALAPPTDDDPADTANLHGHDFSGAEYDTPRTPRSQMTGGGSAAGSGWMVGRTNLPRRTSSGTQDAAAPPFELAVLAGGCASAVVDVCIYPLDTLKTRLQAPQGFRAAGAYTGLFHGVSAAALGAVPGGALFFGSYEYSRSMLQQRYLPEHTWSLDALAASMAATASCILRTPAIVVQQRMQVGQFPSLLAAVRGIAAEGGLAAFYSGLGVSIGREIPFAFVQFPVYEGLKRLWVSSGGAGERELSPSQGALCGSIAGAAAAAATTPLDLIKTRQMLGGAQAGVLHEMRRIWRADGANGLLRGIGPRVGWMALGGYIFFGVYEQIIQGMEALYYPQRRRHRHAAAASDGSGDEPDAAGGAAAIAIAADAAAAADAASSGLGTGAVADAAATPASERPSFGVALAIASAAGGLSGMVIDFVLYPIDTLKTRSIQGLSTEGLAGLRGLYRGIGAAMLPALPSSSAFFVTYEGVKKALGIEPGQSGAESAAKHGLASTIAEAACVTVRVPAEFVKFKLQSAQATSVTGALADAWRQGGVLALYRGYGATLCLDLPFALLQFPLYEHLKAGLMRRRADAASEHESSSVHEAIDGAIAGSLAGSTAAFFTTPLDVMRTRHVLWEGQRTSLLTTVGRIASAEGWQGFWRGAVPRTVYMALGGTLYLGTYSYLSAVFQRLSSRRPGGE